MHELFQTCTLGALGDFRWVQTIDGRFRSCGHVWSSGGCGCVEIGLFRRFVLLETILWRCFVR